ncbi:MAG TPA: MaoC/PaaZ C-terminal domain-containing protein [Solirubrobacteraceae bacterium]|jgi:acyl dehydratase
MATGQLSGPPRILPLYARTIAPLLPGASLLPFVGGRGGELPALELALPQVAVDRDRLAAYTHVCGFSLRDTLPATYPHVLAFGLHLALLTDRRFPFPAIGLVHLSNRIVQHRPIQLGETFDLRVYTTSLQEHPRGRTFALVSEARVAGELVWEDRSTMLRRGARAATERRETSSGDGEPGEDGGRRESEEPGGSEPGVSAAAEPPALPPRSALWRLPGDLGRRYAAVSGDRNPIHMHALSAKAFGFPRAIAHGMWSKAHCLAALEQLLPDSFSVTVDFGRPMLLPGTVAFGSEDLEDRAIGFAVWDERSSKRHLEGRIALDAGDAGGT